MQQLNWFERGLQGGRGIHEKGLAAIAHGVGFIERRTSGDPAESFAGFLQSRERGAESLSGAAIQRIEVRPQPEIGGPFAHPIS